MDQATAGRGGIFFEYDAQFIATGQELSPLNLQLGSGLRSRGLALDAHQTLASNRLR